MRARRHLENAAPNSDLSRKYKLMDALARAREADKERSAVEVRRRDGEYMFRTAAVLTAGAYAAYFLVLLLWSYYAVSGRGIDVTWNVGDSPRTFILAGVACGAGALWLLPKVTGKALSLASFVFVLYEFYQWYEATGSVKANSGVETLTGAGPVGNLLYGAGVVELIILAAVGVLTVLNAYYLFLSLKRYATGHRHRREEERAVDNKHKLRQVVNNN